MGDGNYTGFSREVLDLFDEYVHGGIGRRAFLERCALVAGSAAAASGILAALRPDFARGEVIKADDKRIRTERREIASPEGSGTIRAYIAWPAGASKRAKRPVVLVIHENRGLNPHIEDIARRLAVEGFIAVAPDALTALGGYPGDEDQARALFAKLDQAKIARDFVAAAHFAESLPESNGKLGATGFCYGGGAVNRLATELPELRAAAPFYGAPAPLADVAAIRAELLLHFAGNDTRINGMWPAYEAALKAAGKTYQAFVYPGVEHGFNNDTTPRFNPEAAALAWGRTLDLFRRKLA
jgi:carboxymethylenebutenolidase